MLKPLLAIAFIPLFASPTAQALDFKAMAEKAKALNDARRGANGGGAPSSPSAPSMDAKEALNRLTIARSYDEAKGFLANGVDPNSIEPGTGEPIFINLIDNGYISAARAVFDAGANPNSVSRDGRSALYLMAGSRMIGRDSDSDNLFEALINKGADVNANASYGQGRESVLNRLMAVENIPEATRLKLVTMLLAKGANPNLADGSNKLFPLTRALERRDFELAKLLVENKADVNAVNGDKDSILHIVLKEVDAVRFLVSHGARADLADRDGFTPVMQVAKDWVWLPAGINEPLLAELLKSKHQDFARKSREQRTAISYCQTIPACLKQLKKAGAR